MCNAWLNLSQMFSLISKRKVSCGNGLLLCTHRQSSLLKELSFGFAQSFGVLSPCPGDPSLRKGLRTITLQPDVLNGIRASHGSDCAVMKAALSPDGWTQISSLPRPAAIPGTAQAGVCPAWKCTATK